MTSQLKVDRISPATGDTIIIDGWEIPEVAKNLDSAFLETRAGGYYTSINSDVWGKMPVGEAAAVIEYDYANGFDTANNCWVCPEGHEGTYMIGHGIQLHSGGNTVTKTAGALHLNGVELPRSGSVCYINETNNADWMRAVFPLYPVNLIAGDQVEFYTMTRWTSKRITGWHKFGYRLT